MLGTTPKHCTLYVINCGETQPIIAGQKHIEFMIIYILLVVSWYFKCWKEVNIYFKCGGGRQLVNHKFGLFNCIFKNILNYILSNTVTDSHNLTLPKKLLDNDRA